MGSRYQTAGCAGVGAAGGLGRKGVREALSGEMWVATPEFAGRTVAPGRARPGAGRPDCTLTQIPSETFRVLTRVQHAWRAESCSEWAERWGRKCFCGASGSFRPRLQGTSPREW